MTSRLLIRIIATVGVIVLIALVNPSASSAEDPTPAKDAKPAKVSSKVARAAASKRFQKGVNLYQSGDIRAALIEFKRAYQLAPAYQLLFNIGQASAELNEYVEAHENFTQYLRQGGNSIGRKRREMVERELIRLEGYLAQIEFDISVDGAEVVIDDVVVGSSPLDKPIVVSAGRRKIVVTHQGYAIWQRQIDLAGEDRKRLKVELMSLDVPARQAVTTTRQAPTGRGGAFWTAATATVVLGAGTTVAAILTSRASSDYDKELVKFPNTRDSIEAANDKLKRMAFITDIGIALTASAAITAIILSFRSPSPTRADNERLAIGFGPSQIMVSGHF